MNNQNSITPFLNGSSMLCSKEYIGKVSFKLMFKKLMGTSNSGICKKCGHHWFWFFSKGILYGKVDCPCFREKYGFTKKVEAFPSADTPFSYVVNVQDGHYKYIFG